MTHETPMQVRLALPSEPLRGYISAYSMFEVDSDAPIVDYSVPEWGAIRLILGGRFDLDDKPGQTTIIEKSFIQGPTSGTFKFALHRCQILGVGLYPAGFARFWDIDLGKIANGWTLLGDTLPDLGSALCPENLAGQTADHLFALIDGHFMALLANTKPSHRTSQTVQLHKLLNDPDISRIEDLADAMRLSVSSLASLCRKRFGFPPKLLLRRQRFLRMLEELHARPYSEWPDFVDPQYADQSHMIRDFKFFMGLSPSQYLALPRPVQQMSGEQRALALGKALQGLE